MISVIVPIYNVEKYLPKCIDSILNQTYQDFEVILVNDGSTDGCLKICVDFQNLYPNRIRIINKDNGGLSDARNVGIQAAKGEFISLIDADDYISPYMLETLYTCIQETKADLAACRYVKVKDDNFCFNNGKEERILINGDDLIYGIYTAKYPKIDFVAWNKLYRKETFDKNNFTYPVKKYHEDEYLTHKIMHVCKKIILTNQELYGYRFREDSIVNTPNTDKVFDYIEALEDTMLTYRNNNKLAACSLFRYMAVLYMKRKLYPKRSLERSKINRKIVKYVDLVVRQQKINLKRKIGLVLIAISAKFELLIS